MVNFTSSYRFFQQPFHGIDILEIQQQCCINLHHLSMKAGQCVFRIHHQGDKFYIILRGRVSVLLNPPYLSESRRRGSLVLDKELTTTERNCVRLIEKSQKERLENENKLAQRIQTHIEQVSLEVQREGQSQAVSHSYLDGYLQEDLPKMREELSYEINQRKDVEDKIYSQFIEQINELKEAFEKEKKERESKEEELVNFLREIQHKVTLNILKIKKDREKTEEMLVMLVERVIEKMKKEMVELDI